MKEKSKYIDPCENVSIEDLLDAIRLVETQYGFLRKDLLYPHIENENFWGEYGLLTDDFHYAQKENIDERNIARNRILNIYENLNDNKNLIVAASVYRFGNEPNNDGKRIQYARKLRRAIETLYRKKIKY